MINLLDTQGEQWPLYREREGLLVRAAVARKWPSGLERQGKEVSRRNEAVRNPNAVA